jgi:hypothetical protein
MIAPPGPVLRRDQRFPSRGNATAEERIDVSDVRDEDWEYLLACFHAALEVSSDVACSEGRSDQIVHDHDTGASGGSPVSCPTASFERIVGEAFSVARQAQGEEPLEIAQVGVREVVL